MQYSTPALISNITGGIGTGTSSSGAGSSTGGDGSADPDTSNSNGEGQLGEGSGSKKSSSLGAIIGGVVGAIIALLLLLLLLLLLMRRRKRQRQVDAAAAARDKRGEVGRGDSEESAEGLRGFAYEKTTCVWLRSFLFDLERADAVVEQVEQRLRLEQSVWASEWEQRPCVCFGRCVSPLL